MDKYDAVILNSSCCLHAIRAANDGGTTIIQLLKVFPKNNMAEIAFNRNLVAGGQAERLEESGNFIHFQMK